MTTGGRQGKSNKHRLHAGEVRRGSHLKRAEKSLKAKRGHGGCSHITCQWPNIKA